MRGGHAGSSMDEVATLARVSKQTVYKQFADKQTLFTEILTQDMESRAEELVDALTETDGDEADLYELGRRHIASIVEPDVMRMRRMVIGEADRFPELARAWAEHGVELGLAKLADRFAELAKRGVLRVEDPRRAAEQFNWLVLSIPLNRWMFDPDADYSATELNRFADEGVRVFLAAYGAA